MPIKTILAYLPNAASTPSVLSTARKIARLHGAHIVGLYLEPEVFLYSEYPLELSADVWERLNSAAKATTAEVRKIFNESMDPKAGSFEWRERTVSPISGEEIILDAARRADLVICGKPGGKQSDFRDGLTELLLMQGGRPVLVVPDLAPETSVGDRVTVAWNDTREAARALFDSLDLIRDASSVRVVTFIDDQSMRAPAELSSSAIVASLRRHGIQATGNVSYAKGPATSDALISQLMEEGCDLLVMGGYSHTRFREMIFGGVSRHILRNAPVPVLLSH